MGAEPASGGYRRLALIAAALLPMMAGAVWVSQHPRERSGLGADAIRSALERLRANPQSKFRVLIHVTLAEPTAGVDPERPVVGYWQSLGVACPDRTGLVALVDKYVEDGSVDWEQSEIEPADLDGLPPGIEDDLRPTDDAGIWWSSGRAYYTAEDSL
ncbi:MAG: hypothetical protein HKP27_15245 [Myxococcales bacterium]|nr:hypothetical protein [Myxococcales bacterium]